MSEDEIESRKFGRFASHDSGLIYSEFDTNLHIIEPFNIPSDWQDTISIDPGLNNPLSCHWYARDYDGNVYVVAEHFEENKTIEYHSEKIKTISKELNWKTLSNGMIESLIDSAANQKTLAATKSVTELFYENGIIANPNVNKDVLSGISKVKTYLKNINSETKLYIFSNCVNMIREFKTYRWSNSNSPIKKDDHALDELRYYIMNISASKTQQPRKTAIQKDKEKLIKSLRKSRYEH